MNAPLTGGKWSLREGGIRVPFVVRGPGIAAGTQCDVPVSGIDILPTLFELAGGEQLETVQVIDLPWSMCAIMQKFRIRLSLFIMESREAILYTQCRQEPLLTKHTAVYIFAAGTG